MQRLKAVFKDVNGLHSRIDCFLKQSSVLKVGLIPLKSRELSSTVLDAAIDEPIQSTTWSKAVANRPLTKDVVVTQNPSFEYVETQNSQIVYPVPFNGPSLEYLEVSSLKDSWDHLKHYPLHLYLTDGNGSSEVVSDYPHLMVVDSEQVSAKPRNITLSEATYAGEEIYIDSNRSLRASNLLRESAYKASEFLELRQQSRIEELKVLLDRPAVYEALKGSIISTCESQISDLDALQCTTKPTADWATEKRRRWSDEAHRELQTNYLPGLRRVLYNELSFYKLFLRTDDVSFMVSHVNERAFPSSQAQFQYLMGKLSQKNDAPIPSAHEGYRSPISSLETIMSASSVKLQNQALVSVLSCLGIQLPIAAISLAGVFVGGFSWYSMGALLALGVVSGLKKLQGDWLRAVSKYERVSEASAIKAIELSESQLWGVTEKNVEGIASQKQIMRSTLDKVIGELTA